MPRERKELTVAEILHAERRRAAGDGWPEIAHDISERRGAFRKTGLARRQIEVSRRTVERRVVEFRAKQAVDKTTSGQNTDLAEAEAVDKSPLELEARSSEPQTQVQDGP